LTPPNVAVLLEGLKEKKSKKSKSEPPFLESHKKEEKIFKRKSFSRAFRKYLEKYCFAKTKSYEVLNSMTWRLHWHATRLHPHHSWQLFSMGSDNHKERTDKKKEKKENENHSSSPPPPPVLYVCYVCVLCFVLCLCVLFVCSVCVICLCDMFVCYVCVLCLCVMFVCYVCVLCLCVMFVCYVCFFRSLRTFCSEPRNTRETIMG